MGNLRERAEGGGERNVLMFSRADFLHESCVTNTQRTCEFLPWRFEGRESWPRGSLAWQAQSPKPAELSSQLSNACDA